MVDLATLAPCPICGQGANLILEKVRPVQERNAKGELTAYTGWKDKRYLLIACCNWNCGIRTKPGIFCMVKDRDPEQFGRAFTAAKQIWNYEKDRTEGEVRVYDMEMKLCPSSK